MLGFSALKCPGCGAPLGPEALLRVVTCAFCGASVASERGLVSAAAYRRALSDLDANPHGEPRVAIGAAHYRAFRPSAHGERADLYAAERARRLTERVVLKLARSADGAFLEREHEVLSSLRASVAPGAAHFVTRLPSPIACGIARGALGERPALALRCASGFVHTFEDVRRAHPRGVDPRHAVWMWNRILELLGFVHRSGFAHGAIRPEHLLVHARDHGVMPISWSRAVEANETTARADVAASARAILGVASSMPQALYELARRASEAPDGDAWASNEALVRAARETFGPRSYVPLSMPGWD